MFKADQQWLIKRRYKIQISTHGMKPKQLLLSTTYCTLFQEAFKIFTTLPQLKFCPLKKLKLHRRCQKLNSLSTPAKMYILILKKKHIKI